MTDLNFLIIVKDLVFLSYHKSSLKLHKVFRLVGIGRGWLVLLLVVDIEANGGVGIDPEPLLDHLADPHDGLVVGGVREPDSQLVSPAPDVDHGTVDLSKAFSTITTVVHTSPGKRRDLRVPR